MFFAFQACVSELMREWVWREVDCILYGMFNVKKKNCKKKEKKKKAYPLLPTAVCFSTVQHCDGRAAQSSVFSATSAAHRLEVTASFTELRPMFFAILKGRNPKLWPTQKTHDNGRRGDDGPSPSSPLISPWAHTPLRLFFLFFFFKQRHCRQCIVTKDENTSMLKKKKVLQEFKLQPWVCA